MTKCIGLTYTIYCNLWIRKEYKAIRKSWRQREGGVKEGTKTELNLL